MLPTSTKEHTKHAKSKLILRVRRMKGQLEAAEGALENDDDSLTILRTVIFLSWRYQRLIAKLIDGEIRYHVLDIQSDKTKQKSSADDLIAIGLNAIDSISKYPSSVFPM